MPSESEEMIVRDLDDLMYWIGFYIWQETKDSLPMPVVLQQLKDSITPNRINEAMKRINESEKRIVKGCTSEKTRFIPKGDLDDSTDG